jgi:chromosome segregation ATPase
MQEQPIENELQEIKRRLTRLERHTEPIQITRLEIESGSLYRKLDDVQESTNAVQTKIDSMKGDILNIRESQADIKERLIEHNEELKAIKERQDVHQDLIGNLIAIGESHTKILESHTKSLERIEATMATKDDIKNMATKDDIKNMATKDDIKNMATKDDIKNMATKDDIKNMATKDDISALKGDISRIEKVLHQILEKFQGE